MDLLHTLNQFFYDSSLSELRQMNTGALCPNISYNSLLYLDLIAGKSGCTVSSLAEALHISKPAVTAKVNELVTQGLVKKLQSTKDKRVYHLTLTCKVSEMYSGYAKQRQNAVELLHSKYTEEQVSLFNEMLNAIREEYIKEQ